MAIALSFAVLFGYSAFFETPQIEENKKKQQIEKNNDQSSGAPSVNFEDKKVPNISRDDALRSGKRIEFENENIRGL